MVTTLPWSNVNQISIAFSEPVNVSASSLTLYNSSNTAISATYVGYNATTNIATWQFATTLVAGEYLINIAGDTVSDLDGTELDGAWTTSVSTFAGGSGDGTPGGDFNFYFDVLPGDALTKDAVNNAAVLAAKLQAGSPTTTTNYRLDITGQGSTIPNSVVLFEKLASGTNTGTFQAPNLPPQSAPDVSTDNAALTSNPADAGSLLLLATAASPAPVVVVVPPAPAAGQQPTSADNGTSDNLPTVVATASPAAVTIASMPVSPPPEELATADSASVSDNPPAPLATGDSSRRIAHRDQTIRGSGGTVDGRPARAFTAGCRRCGFSVFSFSRIGR